MLSRAIIAPRDLILDTAEAKRMAFFFDHILIYDGLARQEFDRGQREQYEADLGFLREKGVAIKCMFQLLMSFGYTDSNGKKCSPLDEMYKDCDLLLPFPLMMSTPKKINKESDADNMIRYLSSQLKFKGSIVVAHLAAESICTANQELNALQITLNIPLPPDNLPWEDVIQFRKEEENMAQLRALRLWLQKTGASGTPTREIQEELEHLLYQYQKYMQIQHKKFGQGNLSAVVSALPELTANLVTFHWGDVVKALVDIKGHHIALSEAEFSAPGREISYIANVKKFLST